MNITIVENEFSRDKSICCGVPFYPQEPLEKAWEQIALCASNMPCNDVATYCLSCANGIYYGGKTPHHLFDLLFGKQTVIKETDYVKFREKKIQRGKSIYNM